MTNNFEVDFFAKTVQNNGISIKEINDFINGNNLDKVLQENYQNPFTLINVDI